MHHSGPLLLTFKSPEQGFGGENIISMKLNNLNISWLRGLIHLIELLPFYKGNNFSNFLFAFLQIYKGDQTHSEKVSTLKWKNLYYENTPQIYWKF